MATRTYKIELMVSVQDEGKFAAIEKAICHEALHVKAVCALLADAVPPEIAVYSEDWFKGTSKVDMFKDLVEEGKAQMNETNEKPAEISEALLEALREEQDKCSSKN